MTIYLGNLASSLNTSVELVVARIAELAHLSPAEVEDWRHDRITPKVKRLIIIAMATLELEALQVMARRELNEIVAEEIRQYWLADYYRMLDDFDEYCRTIDEAGRLWIEELVKARQAAFDQLYEYVARMGVGLVEHDLSPR